MTTTVNLHVPHAHPGKVARVFRRYKDGREELLADLDEDQSVVFRVHYACDLVVREVDAAPPETASEL